MPEETIKDRIRQRLKALDLSMREASKAAGMHPDTLGKILQGKSQHPRGDNLSKLARVLKVSEAWLTATEDDSPPEESISGVRFGGVVEAGAFRPDDGLNQDHEYRYIPMAPDRRYPAAEQFAFQVVGDSMELAGIVHGMYVLAVEIHAWERVHGQPGDGRLVIVARTRDHLPERELTVKRLRIYMDRYELQPESPNPAHKAFVSRFPLKEEDQQWAIQAVVVSASWLFV